jgi:hypothetical protein
VLEAVLVTRVDVCLLFNRPVFRGAVSEEQCAFPAG